MADPIGIRQNNPGNIRFGAGFDGEQEGDGGFAAFPDPVSGGRALMQNLLSYSTKHGLNNVQDIISRWAPSSENNTTAYVNAVSQDLGVQPGDTLNMQDPGTLAKLSAAIAKHEGNGAAYTPEFFQNLASNNTELAAYIASAKLPTFSKTQARTAAFHANPTAQGEPVFDPTYMSGFNKTWTTGDTVEQAAALEAGQQEAANTRWAGIGESFIDGWQHNVTGRLLDMAERGQDNPDFKIDETHRAAMADKGILTNQQLSDYVSGAGNQQDWERRMGIAEERLDYFQRAANTRGLSSMGNGAAQLVGGMADPVALIGTMGLGWAANLGRAGVEMSLARSLSGGAVGNMAMGQFVEQADNQKFHWTDLIGQGIQGAALGGMGHLIEARVSRGAASSRGDLQPDPIAQHVANNLQEVVKSRTGGSRLDGIVDPLTGDFNDGISTDLFSRANSPAVRIPEVSPSSYGVLDAARAEREALLPTAGNLADPGVIATARKSLSDLDASVPDLKTLTKEIQQSQGVSYKQAQSLAKARYAELLLDREATRTRLQDTIDSNAQAEQASSRIRELNAQIADMEAQRTAAGQLLTDRTPLAQALHELQGSQRMSIFSSTPEAEAAASLGGVRPMDQVTPERVGPATPGTSPIGFGRNPQVRRTYSGEGNQVARFSRGAAGEGGEITNPRYQQLKQAGVVEEVHSSEVDGLPADAKAWYDPKEGKVFMVRDRLTPQEVADPSGLIAHEVGVHYGLEGVLGTEQYAKVLDQVGKLAETDPRVKEAMDMVPKDTPPHLFLEESLGYLAQHNHNLGLLANIAAGIRTWLRENVPFFKNMGLTTNEILRMVNGAVESARSGTLRNADDIRFSKHVPPTNADLDNPLRRSPAVEAVTEAANSWNEKGSPEAMKQRERRLRWYGEQRPHLGIKGMNSWVDSPGLMVQMSKSKVARYLGAHLFEDAAGVGKRENTVALDYEMTQAGYKYLAIPTIKENLTKGFTPSEKAQFMIGAGQAAENRIMREVAVERLKHRAAVEAGEKYESQAPEHIKVMAKAMDDFYHKVASDGLRAGNPQAEAVMGLGPTGFMPYSWKWEKIAHDYANDRVRFQAFFDNLKQQYAERIVEPAVAEYMKSEGANPAAARDLHARLMEKTASVVDNKVRTIMSDPQSRIDGMEAQMETIASDILDEGFKGSTLDDDAIKKFKDKLQSIRKDKSRTEMDLLREVNGVSLLDYIDHHAVRQATQGAHRWAGLNSLARKGFKDLQDVVAAKEAARIDGATPDEVNALDFGFRAFGLGQLRNHERAAFSTLRNFTYTAIGGKMGLSVLADAANVIAATGVSGFLQTIGTGLFRKSEFLKQVAEDMPSLLGQDYRLHTLTPDMNAAGRAMIGEGSTLNRVSQRGVQLTSWVNGSNSFQSLLHRGFVPTMAEDVIATIRGDGGGMNVARLADMGIDTPMLERIKGQLEQFDSGRVRGDRLNWDNWADQEAADALKNSFHRVTFQTFQRALVGESPMWLSEGAVGSLMGQFRRYGLVSMEKQMVRNVSIGDVNTVSAFVLGTAWAGMLYYARLQMNTAGMDEATRDKYLEDNTKGFKLASGVLNLMNMSGMFPDTVNMGELLFGGNSYRPNTGAPAASMGYLGNVAGAAHAVGNLVTGQSTNAGSDFRHILRAMPFGNTVVGTYYSNTLRNP